MEYVQDITAFINSVGFPIVLTLLLGYLLIKEQENHKKEMTNLIESLNNNTVVMVQLKTLLEEALKRD